jgi:pimeloyl-ACP methyl ester carboxylesterase
MIDAGRKSMPTESKRRLALALVAMTFAAGATEAFSAEAARKREVVQNGAISIDLISEGDGPLIVMLPSRGRDSEDFDDVASELARSGFRVLRPQPRGAGKSTGPSDNIRMQDLAQDVATVISREKAGPAVIAGHAYGNWVARMTVTDHPELVRGIVLIAAAAKTFPEYLRAVVQKAGDAKASTEERLQALQTGFFKQGHEASVWLQGWAPEANRLQGMASTNTKQAEYWNAGKTPMLDLVPEHDPFKPKEKWFESREEFGERVTVKIIPDASHALVPEQPGAVAAAIVEWMRTLR